MERGGGERKANGCIIHVHVSVTAQTIWPNLYNLKVQRPLQNHLTTMCTPSSGSEPAGLT